MDPDTQMGGGTSDPNTQQAPAEPQAKPVFSGTMVEKKDPVSGETIKIPVELDPYIGHLISSTRKNIESQYKPLVEKLEGDTAEFAEVKAELEKLREASMTAEEKAAENARRKIAEHEIATKNAQQQATQWKDMYMNSVVKNDILNSFGDAKLNNPEQVAILMENEGRARVEEVLDSSGKGTGQYQTIVTLQLTNESTGYLENVEGTPKELFKRWCNEERNLHHIQNSLNPGGNSNPGSRKGGKVDYMSLSPTERLNAARENK